MASKGQGQQQQQQQQHGWQPRSSASDEAIFRLPPYYYMHVLDLNSNVTRLEIGPKTYVRQDNERVVLSPTAMLTVPPRFYCVVKNPVLLGADGHVKLDRAGQVCLSHADLEVRLTRDPFPLYPGEELVEPPTELRVVPANHALRLRAVLDCKDESGDDRLAGDEWLFEGPGTYVPRKEVSVEETIVATTIKADQALMLLARREFADRQGAERVTGEEWLVKKVGAYMPGAYEEVVKMVDAYVLVEKTALHVRATRSFNDQLGKSRKNGEEWLVKWTDTETYIPDVHEKVIGVVNVTTLTNRQYCVLLDPVGADGRPQLGKKKLVKGDKSFFLQPGEKLERGIQSVYVLGDNEGIILRALEAFDEIDAGEQTVRRSPGDRWMIRGPAEYVPPVEVEVACLREATPLDENEGIYVRDMKNGKVRAVVGQTYMLTQDEELWAKQLPAPVEELLGSMRDPLAERGAWRDSRKRRGGAGGEQQVARRQMQPASFGAANYGAMQSAALAEQSAAADDAAEAMDETAGGGGKKAYVRDKTKVVTLRVPHNAAVQIYDYKDKRARVVFGPDLVMLGPDEHFTQLSLSGGKPKRPNVIKSLCLLLGPDFCTDVITVETADHARLQLQLSYNWHFDTADRSDTVATKLFSVPDFVGDACKAIASRVRGMVAQIKFDEFHKHSARIIRTAVFGLGDKDKVKEHFNFPQNNLVVTSVDIQSVEPVDQRTRDSLQKSVQLAIEITTNSQEAAARHEAQRMEQEAKGLLERQRITDQAEAEKSKKQLLELQAESAAVESSGQAKAEALSRSEAARIEGEAAVEQARLKADAGKIETDAELDRLQRARESELRYQCDRDAMEVKKKSELAQIDTEKFRSMVTCLGADTIRAIASAGTDNQLKMLQALGLKTALITDGKSPINLLSTAHGLIGSSLAHGGAGAAGKPIVAEADGDDDDQSSQ